MLSHNLEDYLGKFQFPAITIGDRLNTRRYGFKRHLTRKRFHLLQLLSEQIFEPGILEESKTNLSQLVYGLKTKATWTGCKPLWKMDKLIKSNCVSDFNPRCYLVPFEYPVTFDSKGGGISLVLLVEYSRKTVYANAEEPVLSSLTFWTINRDWETNRIKKFMAAFEQAGILRRKFEEVNTFITNERMKQLNGSHECSENCHQQIKLDDKILQKLKSANADQQKISSKERANIELTRVSNEDILAAWRLLYLGFIISICSVLLECTCYVGFKMFVFTWEALCSRK